MDMVERTYDVVVRFSTPYPVSQDAARELWVSAQHFAALGTCSYERRSRTVVTTLSPLEVIEAVLAGVMQTLREFELMPTFTGMSAMEVLS